MNVWVFFFLSAPVCLVQSVVAGADRGAGPSKPRSPSVFSVRRGSPDRAVELTAGLPQKSGDLRSAGVRGQETGAQLFGTLNTRRSASAATTTLPAVRHFVFKPCADMERANLDVMVPSGHETALLILCPGVNGSGDGLIRQETWRAFAREHKLGLVGLSFASKVSLLQSGRGYYYASQGSGQLLLNGLREIYGKDLPVLLFGFSGGAHFASRFAEWKPERVIAWSAQSAGWWDEPKAAQPQPNNLGVIPSLRGISSFRSGKIPDAVLSLPKDAVPSPSREIPRKLGMTTFITPFQDIYAIPSRVPSEQSKIRVESPPGLIACGDYDVRYGESLMYFKRGRAVGKPWLWVSVPGVGHATSPPLEEFVREYFSAILQERGTEGMWLDVDLKTQAETSLVVQYPSITAWLPDVSLMDHWNRIHEP